MNEEIKYCEVCKKNVDVGLCCLNCYKDKNNETNQLWQKKVDELKKKLNKTELEYAVAIDGIAKEMNQAMYEELQDKYKEIEKLKKEIDGWRQC